VAHGIGVGVRRVRKKTSRYDDDHDDGESVAAAAAKASAATAPNDIHDDDDAFNAPQPPLRKRMVQPRRAAPAQLLRAAEPAVAHVPVEPAPPVPRPPAPAPHVDSPAPAQAMPPLRGVSRVRVAFESSAPVFDVDFYNLEVRTEWLLTLTHLLCFASTQFRFCLLPLGNKLGARVGLRGAVQLLVDPPVFVRQADHSALIEALCACDDGSMVLTKPNYTRFDYRKEEGGENDFDGDVDTAPVPFAVTAAFTTASRLVAVLRTVGVSTVRTTRFNGKTPLADFIAMYAPYIVTDPWSQSVLDVSAVVRIDDGTSIALVGATGLGVSVMELCGALGEQCGSVSAGPLLLGDGLRYLSTWIYSSRLVHHLKADGLKSTLQSHDSVRQAAEYRRRLVPALEQWCAKVESPQFRDRRRLGELRFEVRVQIDHGAFLGTWDDLLERTALWSLDAFERAYAAKAVQCKLVLISVADYVANVRAELARLQNPKYQVGFSVHGQASSINAVKLRFCDMLACVGMHVGLRMCNCINRAAVRNQIDPSYAEVDAGGSIFDAGFVAVEPQLPPLPLADTRPNARAFVLFIGGRMDNRATANYLAAKQRREHLRQFGYDLPPVPFTANDSLGRKVQQQRPQQRLEALFGDEAQVAFANEHPLLNPHEALRMQMFAQLDIIPKGNKFTIKKNGQFVKGSTASTVEKVLDIMMEQHRGDWQQFDQKKTS
jgi:hypothetical protein